MSNMYLLPWAVSFSRHACCPQNQLIVGSSTEVHREAVHVPARTYPTATTYSMLISMPEDLVCSLVRSTWTSATGMAGVSGASRMPDKCVRTSLGPTVLHHCCGGLLEWHPGHPLEASPSPQQPSAPLSCAHPSRLPHPARLQTGPVQRSGVPPGRMAVHTTAVPPHPKGALSLRGNDGPPVMMS